MLKGYIGIIENKQVYLTDRKDYKPLQDTYIVLSDTNDVILNGYVVGVYKNGIIKSNPDLVKFPFDPIKKEIIKEEKKYLDNKDSLVSVRTTLYYTEEEEGEEENEMEKWVELEDNQGIEDF